MKLINQIRLNVFSQFELINNELRINEMRESELSCSGGIKQTSSILPRLIQFGLISRNANA